MYTMILVLENSEDLHDQPEKTELIRDQLEKPCQYHLAPACEGEMDTRVQIRHGYQCVCTCVCVCVKSNKNNVTVCSVSYCEHNKRGQRV